MRAIRIALAAWVSTLIVILAVPSLRSHLGYAFKVLTNQASIYGGKGPAPEPKPGMSKDHALEYALYQSQLAWNGGGRTSNLDALTDYCHKYPEEVGPRAILVRMAVTSGGRPWSPKGDQVDMWRKRGETLLEISRQEEVREPNNWFWRMGEVQALSFLGRDKEANVALTRAPLPMHYNDRAFYEPQARITALNQGFWGSPKFEQIEVYASVMFPHFSAYNTINKAQFSPTWPLEQRLAWLNLGTAMAKESDTLIGALVGKGVIIRTITNSSKGDSGIKSDAERKAARLAKFSEFEFANAHPLSLEESKTIRSIIESEWKFEDAMNYTTLAIGLLGPMFTATAVLLLGAALFNFIPLMWKPAKGYFAPILVFVVSFPYALIQIRFNQSTFSVSNGSEDNFATVVLLWASLLIGIGSLLLVVFNKRMEHRAIKAVAIVSLTGLAAGISNLTIPCVLTILAIHVLDKENQLDGLVFAPGLFLTALITAMSTRNSAVLVFFFLAAIGTAVVTRPRSLIAPLAWWGLAALFIGLPLGRIFDRSGEAWLEGDRQQLAKIRADF